jgi:hypothetical protein
MLRPEARLENCERAAKQRLRRAEAIGIEEEAREIVEAIRPLG